MALIDTEFYWHMARQAECEVEQTFYLLMRCYYEAPPRTQRQKEIARLWIQRGLLERTRAGLREILRDSTIKFSNDTAFNTYTQVTYSILAEAIRENQKQIVTVKDRIQNVYSD